MKKLIILIVSVWTVNTLNAQSTDLAFASINSETFAEHTAMSERSIKRKSTFYYADARDVNTASTIKNMEDVIVNYNLKNNNIFDDSERANYRVVFKQKNAKAIVNYNTNGEIISSKEKYKGVKLPFQISAAILQNNYRFHIKKTTVYKKYKRNSGFQTAYKVVISDGKETRTVKISE